MTELKLIPHSKPHIRHERRRHLRSAAACDNCLFFRRPSAAPNSNHGECRIEPPVLIEIGKGLVTMWPSVHSDDWCGEHVRAHKRRRPK